MGIKTTALTLAGKDSPWHLEEIELDDPLPDEVLVKFEASGICHSDLSVQSGVLPLPLPAVAGHEGSGRVLAIGSQVTRVKVGDAVLTSFTSCTSCKACRHDEPFACAEWFALNFTGQRTNGQNTAAADSSGKRIGMTFFGQSSFSNHALVPEQACVKVPDDTDLVLCASLGCGIQTGYGAISNILKPTPSSGGILIVGLGAVGMSALFAAVNAGMRPIIGCDIVEARLELAKSFGAHFVINSGKPGFKDEILKATDGDGPDNVCECTGVPACIEWSYNIMRNRGVHLQVGAPGPGKLPPFDIQGLTACSKTFVGALEGFSDLQTFIPFLVKQYQNGKLPLDKISQTFPIEDFQNAFAAMKDATVIKPILVF